MRPQKAIGSPFFRRHLASVSLENNLHALGVRASDELFFDVVGQALLDEPHSVDPAIKTWGGSAGGRGVDGSGGWRFLWGLLG